MEPSPREEGEDGPPPAARVHNNREGDDEGGKGNGGRGYEDNGDNGSDGGDNDAKRRRRQRVRKQQKQRQSDYDANNDNEGGLAVVNPAEIIKAEDIVVPMTPPLRPRLPHCDTLLSDLLSVVSRKVV